MDQQVVVDNGLVSSGDEEEGKGGEAATGAIIITTTSAAAAVTSSQPTSSSTSTTPTNRLLQRHYSTIGIGDVFAVLLGDGEDNDDNGGGSPTNKPQQEHRPPPPLPSCYLNLENNNNNNKGSFYDDNNSFISWEIVGTIKSVPEDFIVREIGLFATGEEKDDGDDENNNKEKKASSSTTTSATTSKILRKRPCFNIPGISTQQLAEMRVADINVPPLITLAAAAGTCSDEYRNDPAAIDTTTTASTSRSTTEDAATVSTAKTMLTSSKQLQPINSSNTTTNNNINNESDLIQQEEDSVIQRRERQNESKKSSQKQQQQLSPIEVLKIELQHAKPPPPPPTTTTTTVNKEVQPAGYVNIILKELDQLNELAKELLLTTKNKARRQESSLSNNGEKNDEVCFSITGEEGNKDTAATTTTTSFNRGAFHWAMRVAYPLLLANSVVVDEEEEEEEDNGANDKQKQQQHNPSAYRTNNDPSPTAKNTKTITFHIRVTIEDTFRDLIPSLYEPQVDIPSLYLFLKSGIGATTNRSGGKQNTILKLRPDLPRSDRRPIHQMIEDKTNSSLATRTLPEYECSISSESSIKTAAIVVYWSKTAGHRATKKKRKREQQQHEELKAPGGKQHDPYPHVLFVLKKTQIEHLNAMQILTTALNCRQGDVGAAGIKDMKAVTYQFCTLSNFPLPHLLRAQETLTRRRIEIGNVHKVNWTLRKGDLEGNRFQIMIRNTRRVRVIRGENDIIREDFVNCDVDHMQAAVDRLKNHGFINFYGEQRMGAAGLESIVGVRAFDIGKAMLQRKYSKAIDLLMTGRLVCRGTSEVENDEIRAMRKKWKESNGDPFETWKCMPRSASVPREKLVLKGLKRYGRNNPLSALRCLQYNERVFFISCYQSYLWNVMATERIQRYGIHKVIPGDLVIDKDEAVVIVDGASCDHYLPEHIVLPMPGYDTVYPTNEIGDLCKETLRLDGVSFEKDAPLESTAKGSYRHLLAKATNISFEAIRGSGGELHSKLKFDLPRGSYATMVLREIMLTTVVRE